MTPEDMSAKITTARATFSPLTGKPKYGNLVRLIKCITPILLRIPIKTVDGDLNLWVMLSANAAYKARYREVFYTPTRPVVYLNTPDYTTSVFRSHAKTIHKFLWHDFKLHKAAEIICRAFIIDAVKGTWIRKFCHAYTIYADVTTKVLFFKETVTGFDLDRETIPTGWNELHSTQLWQLLLRPEVDELPPSPPSATATMLGAFSAYDPPSVEALV